MKFIKGNFPSFKNSKQFTGKYFIMSKTVQKYLKQWEYQWEDIPIEFKEVKEEQYPIVVGIHIVRGTKHRYDFHNGVQGIADLMVKHGWIPDDNMNYFIPQCLFIDSKPFSYSKEEPGVYITLMSYAGETE